MSSIRQPKLADVRIKSRLQDHIATYFYKYKIKQIFIPFCKFSLSSLLTFYSLQPNMSKHIPVKVDIAHPSDLYKIAALESKVFYNDPVFIIALGDNRAGPTQTQHRADKLDNLARKKGETVKIFKAMLGDEIVGSAVAVTVRNRKGDGDELREEVKEKEEKGGRWGPGADVRFCEDVFTRGDGYMRAACGEEDYASSSLLVSSHSILLSPFLSETVADLDRT